MQRNCTGFFHLANVTGPLLLGSVGVAGGIVCKCNAAHLCKFFYELGLPEWGQLELDYVSYAWFLSLCLLETAGF